MGGVLALEATGILTQDAEQGITNVFDACNGFNELIRLAVIWTVSHRWPVGARFTLNLYRHWAQLLLRQPVDAPVIILRLEGVTQNEPLSMLLYGITPVPLAEELRDADPTILSPFYADDVVFDRSAQRSAAQL